VNLGVPKEANRTSIAQTFEGKSGQPIDVAPKKADAGPALTLVERLERTLVLAAQIVLQHGPVYAPYIDRLELELDKARKTDPTERAKRILERYTAGGDANAMRLSQSRLCSKDGPTP
jgi:hypothetical protein